MSKKKNRHGENNSVIGLRGARNKSACWQYWVRTFLREGLFIGIFGLYHAPWWEAVLFSLPRCSGMKCSGTIANTGERRWRELNRKKPFDGWLRILRTISWRADRFLHMVHLTEICVFNNARITTKIERELKHTRLKTRPEFQVHLAIGCWLLLDPSNHCLACRSIFAHGPLNRDLRL